MEGLLAVGVPYPLGDGRFEATPLVAMALTLLVARAAGLRWSRITVGPLLILGLSAGYAAQAWGVAPVSAATLAAVWVAATVLRRLDPPRRC